MSEQMILQKKNQIGKNLLLKELTKKSVQFL